MTITLIQIENGWTVSVSGVDRPDCQKPMWFKETGEALDYIKKICDGQ